MSKSYVVGMAGMFEIIFKGMNQFSRSRTCLVFLATFMCVLPIASSDIYFSILPEIGASLRASTFEIKLSLSLFLLGFGAGQLVYGFLSDRFGRKKLLLLGLSLYLLATFGCALSRSADSLNYFRLLQGLGVCSGAVIGRAVVSDFFEAKESASVFATMFIFIGLSPALSPTLGGVITMCSSWRGVFVFLLIIGCLLFVLTVFLFREPKFVSSSDIRSYIKDCWQLRCNTRYLCFSIFVCLAYVAWFAFVTDSSYVFAKAKLNILERSMLYSPLALAYMAGNFSSKRCLKFSSIKKVIQVGVCFFSLGTLIVAAYAIAHLSLVIFIVGMVIIVFANGHLLPVGTAGALGAVTTNKGAATAILGFVQLSLSALGAFFMAEFSSNKVVALVVLFVMFSLVLWGAWCKLGRLSDAR